MTAQTAFPRAQAGAACGASSPAPSVSTRIRAYIILVRPSSCLIGCLATGIGAYLATGRPFSEPVRCILAVTGIALAIAFANVINDVADLATDAVEKPRRPIPAGHVSRRAARRFAVALAAGAVLVTGPLGLPLAGGTAALVGTAYAYSARLKDTVLLGNAVVALCSGSSFVYGAATVSATSPGRTWATAGAAAAAATVFMFGYEVLKTAADRAGDAAASLRTVATVTGPRTVRRVFLATVVTQTVIVLTATAVSWHPARYLAVVPTLLVPTWYVALRLPMAADSPGGMRRLVVVMRSVWLLGPGLLWTLR